MIDFEIGVLIDRRIEEVFDYVSNPINLPYWQTMLLEITPLTPGSVVVGSKFSTKGEMMGRKIEGQMEITHLQPPASFGYQAKAGPMQINGLISLKSAGTGAKVTLKLHAEPGGLFKLAEGLLLNQVKNQMQANLDRLKTILEAGA